MGDRLDVGRAVIHESCWLGRIAALALHPPCADRLPKPRGAGLSVGAAPAANPAGLRGTERPRPVEDQRPRRELSRGAGRTRADNRRPGAPLPGTRANHRRVRLSDARAAGHERAGTEREEAPLDSVATWRTVSSGAAQ